MKKIAAVLIMLFLPLSMSATILEGPSKQLMPPMDIPSLFASSSETAILEWGCPVSEFVSANSSVAALTRIQDECLEEVKRAATEKPGVFEVIEASVIWPDVIVSEQKGGFWLQGTFFLETLVLQGSKGIAP